MGILQKIQNEDQGVIWELTTKRRRMSEFCTRWKLLPGLAAHPQSDDAYNKHQTVG
jgi:hypothetical protein